MNRFELFIPWWLGTRAGHPHKGPPRFMETASSRPVRMIGNIVAGSGDMGYLTPAAASAT